MHMSTSHLYVQLCITVYIYFNLILYVYKLMKDFCPKHASGNIYSLDSSFSSDERVDR